MPVATPVAIPVSEPIDAIALLLLAHVPPLTASESIVVSPVHTEVTPEMGAENGKTVKVILAWQPDVSR